MSVLTKYYYKKGPPAPNFFIGNVGTTFRVKAADTLYNDSDFSNTFTGSTL